MLKMKIAYNSAYVQIETFNFTFAQQTFIVYFYCTKQSMQLATMLPHVKFCCYRRPAREMKVTIFANFSQTSTSTSSSTFYRKANET